MYSVYERVNFPLSHTIAYSKLWHSFRCIDNCQYWANLSHIVYICQITRLIHPAQRDQCHLIGFASLIMVENSWCGKYDEWIEPFTGHLPIEKATRTVLLVTLNFPYVFMRCLSRGQQTWSDLHIADFILKEWDCIKSGYGTRGLSKLKIRVEVFE
jgi:hypothetical protein